jgi:hypothetical protein
VIFFKKPKFEVYQMAQTQRCCYKSFRHEEDARRYAEELWTLRHDIHDNIILKSIDGRIFEVS